MDFYTTGHCPGKPEKARIRRLAGKLHDLGKRPLAEYLTEILEGAPIMARLEKYAAFDAEFIKALGGSELPPLRIVEGGRDD